MGVSFPDQGVAPVVESAVLTTGCQTSPQALCDSLSPVYLVSASFLSVTEGTAIKHALLARCPFCLVLKICSFHLVDS